MKTSESIDKISPAIVKAQGEIGHAVFDAKNTFFKSPANPGGSKYATLGAVISALKPALISNGLGVLQFPEESANGAVLNLTTRIVHSSGQWVEATATVPLVKTDPQGYGSALSYAKRYSLASIFLIYAEEDDDGNSAVQKPAQAPQVVDTDTGEVIERKSPREQLEEAKTLEQLQALFKKFWQGSDGKTQKQLKQTYDACKAKFVGVAA